ncbi:hypothetical protein M0805_007482 [Coniferiporia weirii]|nr:hypothetical protein M0805_007482 [Coniferiporia weirii]
MFRPGKHLPRCLYWRSSVSQRFASTKCVSKELQISRRTRYAWYALGGLSASALGLWFWEIDGSRHVKLLPLSPFYFTQTTLASSESTSESGKLIRLSLPPGALAGLSDHQPIWSVYVKDSDIQVERPYTPIEGISASGEMTFWIKKYPHGEVGRWIHSRLPGEVIEIRGPQQTWAWKDGDWNNIIMIAGGTGIVPFFQLLHTYFARKPEEQQTTKFTLLQSYRSPNELPAAIMREKLASWSQDKPEELEIRTFVDNMDGATNQSGLVEGRISKADIKAALGTSNGKTIILVCGPEPMMEALAGPKNRDQSQGPVGGVLGEMDSRKFDVWKL